MYPSLVGLAPFAIILGAATVTGLFIFSGRLKPDDVGDLVFAIMMITAAIWVIAIVTQMVCLNFTPYEKFTDAPPPTHKERVTTLFKGIAAAEKSACSLITRTNKFIAADQGHAGQQNPDLVTQAQAAAVAAAGGPLVDCDVSGTQEETLTDAENRLTRLETTLNAFTGPEIEKTYNNTVPCQPEGFADVSGEKLGELEKRLDAVQTLIQTQETKYLKPIDQKTEQLRKGQASDCDKQRGAKVAVTTSNKTPATPSS